MSEKEDYSSVSDAQVSQLQAEILQQSKVIEQFIKNTSKDEDSASFSFLKSLFVLFKSELSINLKLRTILVDERNKFSQIKEEIKYFFRSLQKLGFTNLKDFRSVLDFISNQDKYYQDFQKSVFKTIKSEKHKNKKLQSQLVNLQQISSLNNDSNDEKEKEISNLTEKIAQYEQNFQLLNKSVQDKEDMINSLKKIIDEKKEDNEKSKILINNLEKELQELKQSNQSKNNENANKYMLNQIHSLQKENEMLKQIQKDNQTKKEREIMDLNAQNIIDIETIKAEYIERCNAIKSQKDNIENQLKTELDDIKTCNIQLKQQLTELYQSNEKLKQQLTESYQSNDNMKQHITEKESNIKELRQINTNLYQKIKKMKNKFKKVKRSFNELNNNHQIEIEQIKEEFDSQLKSSISQVETDVRNKIEQSESVNRQLRITIDEQKTEVNSLRDLVKKLSLNLQQEEAENARMQASLQMHKYNSLWNPTENRKREHIKKKNSSRQDYSYSPLASDSSAI